MLSDSEFFNAHLYNLWYLLCFYCHRILHLSFILLTQVLHVLFLLEFFFKNISSSWCLWRLINCEVFSFHFLVISTIAYRFDLSSSNLRYLHVYLLLHHNSFSVDSLDLRFSCSVWNKVDVLVLQSFMYVVARVGMF